MLEGVCEFRKTRHLKSGHLLDAILTCPCMAYISLTLFQADWNNLQILNFHDDRDDDDGEDDVDDDDDEDGVCLYKQLTADCRDTNFSKKQ